MNSKLLSLCLTLSLVPSAFGQTTASNAPSDFRRQLAISAEKPVDLGSAKSTKAEYDRRKRQGQALSNTAKVMIIGGIAAAVIAIVIVAGKNDLQNNILR